MYKTLPAALRRGGHHGHDKDEDDDDTDGTAAAGTASESSSVPPRSQSRASTRGVGAGGLAGQEAGGLFGLNIGISNLISGGIRDVHVDAALFDRIFQGSSLLLVYSNLPGGPLEAI